jgi:hypothetical protein
MKRRHRCVIIGFVLIVSAAATLRAEVETPREAAPVIAMLKAVKDLDVAGFKNAYSKEIREDKGQGTGRRT